MVAMGADAIAFQEHCVPAEQGRAARAAASKRSYTAVLGGTDPEKSTRAGGVGVLVKDPGTAAEVQLDVPEVRQAASLGRLLAARVQTAERTLEEQHAEVQRVLAVLFSGGPRSCPAGPSARFLQWSVALPATVLWPSASR